MRSFIVAIALVSLLPLTASAQSIEGVWRLVGSEATGGNNPGTVSSDEIQPGLVIFTESHYSITEVRGRETRPMLNEAPSEAELGRVFRPFTSNAGTYELSGTT